jgi:hypothetical protein
MAFMTRWILKVAQSLFFVALTFFAYVGWLQWEVHKMKSFCGDVRPGTPVADLRAIADRHGVNLGKHEGIYDESSKDWFLLVPVVPTFGDVICSIHHDKTVVRSAAMEGL